MWKWDRSKVNSSQHLWKLSRKVHGAYFWLLKVPLLFWSYLVIGNYCLEFFFSFRCFSPYWDVCLLPRASKTFWMNPKSLKHCLTAFISLPQSQPSYNQHLCCNTLQKCEDSNLWERQRVILWLWRAGEGWGVSLSVDVCVLAVGQIRHLVIIEVWGGTKGGLKHFTMPHPSSPIRTRWDDNNDYLNIMLI